MSRNVSIHFMLRSGGRTHGASGGRVANVGNRCGWPMAISRTPCASRTR
ncbi:Uncharacterised protein [Mycobacteroides abscessus subsp. abscessus]|nr:Uncharacterised protein [Mycobacteroides abscessus subsp. abscessus]SLE18069.1 Uncharacterised protein [Mycobacteroides abscessus subsp. massiliense]